MSPPPVTDLTVVLVPLVESAAINASSNSLPAVVENVGAVTVVLAVPWWRREPWHRS